jgi:heterodisulfide reductase subunit D
VSVSPILDPEILGERGVAVDKFSVGQYFAEINTLADLQFIGEEKPYIDRPASAAPAAKELLLYLGCNVLKTTHLVRTVIDVLKAMGFDFNTAGGPAHCCGIVHLRHGQSETAGRVAAMSMRHFGRYGARHVLMWCPSCNDHYDDVVGEEQGVEFTYEPVTAFIARHIDRVPFVRAVNKRVAVHHHCGSQRSVQDWQNVRTILCAIPGLKLLELRDQATPGRNCTAVWIRQIGRAHWESTMAGVLEAARDSQADVLATVHSSCHREICAQEANYPFAIVHYISLLGEALGIEYPDIFKHHRIRADPEATFKDVSPYVEAKGLDPARVREVLLSAFAPPEKRKIP